VKDFRSIQPIVYLLGLAGLALFIILLLREGAGQVGSALARAGWGLFGLTLYHLVQTLSDSAGWLVLIPSNNRIRLSRSFFLHWMGESINNLLPTARVGGDIIVARVAAMWGMPLKTAIAAIIVDVTIGIVLAWALGLGVLFISLYRGYATEAYALLFGQILGISSGDVAVTLVAGIVTVVALVVVYRPLLFSSVDEELAGAKGVPITALSIGFMAILAVAVTEAVQVVGVLLIFALIVTPAAIAVRFTSRPPMAILIGIILALAFTWLGLSIAFFSPHPVSFFITSLAFAAYVAVRVSEPLRQSFGSAIGPR